MTTATGSNHRGMVHLRYRIPGRGRMTVTTEIISINMGSRFTCGCSPIMAGAAGSGYSAMVNGCPGPNVCVMARITTGCSRNVCSWFTCSCSPVMATGAGSGYRSMIHPCYRIPDYRGVTTAAEIIGTNVCSRFSCGCGSVMTSAAGSCYSAMIEHSGKPSG